MRGVASLVSAHHSIKPYNQVGRGFSFKPTFKRAVKPPLGYMAKEALNAGAKVSTDVIDTMKKSIVKAARRKRRRVKKALTDAMKHVKQMVRRKKNPSRGKKKRTKKEKGRSKRKTSKGGKKKGTTPRAIKSKRAKKDSTDIFSK